MSRIQRLTLRLAVFLAGALLMALEVAAFRIIGKTFGAALRETTTVIAVFLAAMSAGYWAGGRVGDRWPRPSTLVATLLAAAGTLLVVPWLDAWLSPRIAESGLALATHAFLATTVLFAIPTFLLAATSPIAVRLFSTSTNDSGSTAGSISAISTAGSIAGSLATAFFLIDWLESIARTVLFVSAGAAATAMLVLLPARRLLTTAAGALTLVTLTAAFARTGGIERALLDPLPNTRVLFVGDSPYHRVTVIDRGPSRELTFNVGPQTRMLRHDPDGPGLAYTDAAHIGRLLRPHARRILILGLGGGTQAKQFSKYYADTIVDVVEVDPLVVDVSKRLFDVQPNDRLRIHLSDARTFIKRSSAQWDLIVVDVTSTNRYGETTPAHLVTREFFEEVAERLTPDGIVHYHCPFHQTQLMPALHKSMSSVFPNVVHTPGEILASRATLNVPPGELLARLAGSPARRLPNLRGQIEGLTSEPIPSGDVPLLTDDYAPADTLLRTRR